MAITSSTSWTDAIFDAGRAFFHHKRNQLRKVFARRRGYRTTYHELSVLSDRDLRDLGIPRNRIKELAREAIHDC
ncbi:protein of unknown function [Aliiroseovarius sediminilitoris]|uniref:YjiS-like domain-containing protein n=1 Tax=Aliiroseovarius sediminilitoris TaxID=1173584 RepID=A0A1I0MYT1_9RHOB|nr:protein of unknown function [Aliiroseovarius sediminilitoris]